MTTETTDPSFDAFERRLAAALASEAGAARVPPDGRALVDARVRRRRRTRRATWLAAAAALVLVAGVVGVVARSTSTDSSPYVDDRPLIPADGPPLVLPRDPRYLPRLVAWDLDAGYGVWLDDTSRSLDERQAFPGVMSFRVRPTPGPDPQADVQPVKVGDVDAELFAYDGTPRLRWPVGRGYVAELDGSLGSSGSMEQLVDDLQEVARSVENVPPDLLLQLIERPRTNEDAATADGFRMGLAQGDTYLLESLGSEFTVALVRPGLPANTYLMRSARAYGSSIEPITGDRVDIRGTTGRIGTRVDGRGVEYTLLSWREDGWTHSVAAKGAVDQGSIEALVEELVTLDETEWRQAVFPPAAPPGLPSSLERASLWLSNADTLSDTTTTLTASGS